MRALLCLLLLALVALTQADLNTYCTGVIARSSLTQDSTANICEDYVGDKYSDINCLVYRFPGSRIEGALNACLNRGHDSHKVKKLVGYEVIKAIVTEAARSNDQYLTDYINDRIQNQINKLNSEKHMRNPDKNINLVKINEIVSLYNIICQKTEQQIAVAQQQAVLAQLTRMKQSCTRPAAASTNYVQIGGFWSAFINTPSREEKSGVSGGGRIHILATHCYLMTANTDKKGWPEKDNECLIEPRSCFEIQRVRHKDKLSDISLKQVACPVGQQIVVI